jgi:hypothetical protein
MKEFDYSHEGSGSSSISYTLIEYDFSSDVCPVKLVNTVSYARRAEPQPDLPEINLSTLADHRPTQ